MSPYLPNATESQTNALVVDARRPFGYQILSVARMDVSMAQSPAIEILQTAAMPTHDPDAFDRQFHFHRCYLAADPIPAAVGMRIRGIAAADARRIDAQVTDSWPHAGVIASCGADV